MMKTILRIFNIVIMAISALATIFLFASPVISFNSKIAIDLAPFSEFVPSTPYTEDLDIVSLLGTDTIEVGIKFSLNMTDTNKVLNKDKDFVNNGMIGPNVDGIFDILHEPVNLITEYYVRTFLKGLIKDEITQAINDAKNKYGATDSTAEEIMEEVGMDDAYFNDFTYAMYRAADKDDATTDSITEVLYAQIDDALAKAEETGVVDTSGYTEENKASLKEDVISNLDAMELVNEDVKANRGNDRSDTEVYMKMYESYRDKMTLESDYKAGDTNE